MAVVLAKEKEKKVHMLCEITNGIDRSIPIYYPRTKRCPRSVATSLAFAIHRTGRPPPRLLRWADPTHGHPSKADGYENQP